jgi:hypothetical protein
MNDNFKLNYIKCPDCKNILDLSFIDKACPNPICGFNFDGLAAFLDKDEDKLHKAIVSAYKGDDERKTKLLTTAIRLNIASYLSHFISCGWNAHYQTLFKDFIVLYLDDLNAVKMVLSSDVIRPDKDNIVISKTGHRMFWELYKYLMRIHSPEIRDFLRLEFPTFYRKWYKEIFKKNRQPKTTTKNINQIALV